MMMVDRRRHANIQNISSRYFAWLCELIEVNQPEDSYFILAGVLYKKPFNVKIEHDENRAEDGLDLRDRFIEEEYGDRLIPHIESFLDTHCTMLELLIGLAYRFEFTMADQHGDIPMDEWFWKLLENVGLDEFTDEAWVDRISDLIVNDKLDTIINRTYDRSGKGGLFPLKYYKKDQRKVELWYQMSSYIIENYY